MGPDPFCEGSVVETGSLPNLDVERHRGGGVFCSIDTAHQQLDHLIAREAHAPADYKRGAQASLFTSALLVGGLLALFGQTYQTGANLLQLFFTWSLRILPEALIARLPAL